MRKPQEYIVSRQNTLVKAAAALSERKVRERDGLFRFDGKKLLLEALDKNLPLTAVLLRESSLAAVMDFVGERELPTGCRAVVLSDAVFDKISEEKAPDGVICVSKRLDKIHKIVTINKWRENSAELKPGKTLLLESVRDPGNLGTIIRSAAAFGVSQVVISTDCADLYHPRVLRAAMGALFSTRVLVTDDLLGAISLLRERGSVYAAALDDTAVRLGKVNFAESDAVVVGNEGHGISSEVLAACSATLYIPMAGGVESLNAGVAASLLLWEFYRDN